MKRRLFTATALSMCAGLLTPAHAQDAYPSKIIRLVVPFAPGGSADAAARILAPKLAEKLGQPVVVDNRPGAGGGLAITQVAKSPADGYTILLAAAGALTIAPNLNANLGYNPVTDLQPITGFARIPFVLVANSDAGMSTPQDVIKYAKANPGKLSFGSTGNATAQHIAGEMMMAQSQSFIVHVPYRGSGPAAVAAMSGEVQLAVVDLAAVIGQRNNPKIKLVATMGKTRSPLVPDVPTLSESSLPGFDVTGWFGLFAPAKTPAPIVTRLNAEIVALLRSPEFGERFKALGMEPQPSSSEALRDQVRGESASYATIIKRAGIKLD